MCKFISGLLKKRCVKLDEPILQKKVLITEIEVIKEEDINGNMADKSRHVKLYEIDKKIKCRRRFIVGRKHKKFKISATKGRCEDIKKLLLLRR